MMKPAVMVFMVLITSTGLQASVAHIWVIGSTRSYEQSEGKSAGKEEVIAKVRQQFTQVLGGGKPLNVVFEDVYRSRDLETAYGGRGSRHTMEYHAHSLAQWFYWPEGRAERLASLRGEGTTPFSYVVLIGDPSIISSYPGMYATGVASILKEMEKGSARPILLIPGTPQAGSSVAEVVLRVSRSSGVTVIPSQQARAHAGSVEGPYTPEHPFAGKKVSKRVITYHHTGTSSERGIEGALKAVAPLAGVQLRRVAPEKAEGLIDFNYGRGNSNFEADKRYKVDPETYARSYGFPMQDHVASAATTMLYGLDRRQFQGGREEDGTDLGIARDMVKEREVRHDVRCIPIRTLWAELHDLDPSLPPLRDSWHMSRALDHASAAYILTLLTGRTPVGDPPAETAGAAYANWLGRKVGYETAWRMGWITTRAPGFSVRWLEDPQTLSPGSKARVEIRFRYPPAQDVHVALFPSTQKDVTLEPQRLTFTPENHDTPQTASLTVEGGSGPLTVAIQTRSEDSVFDRLEDRWEFKIQSSAK